MTQQDFIEQLREWQNKFNDEVVLHFQKLDKERGEIAFEGWKERFISFLDKYTPSEAEKFIAKTTYLILNTGYRIRNPFQEFKNQYGNVCNAFIENLIEDVSKGYIEISENELFESPKESSSLISKLETSKNTQTQIDKSKVFVVHGQDNEAKESVARFLQKLNLEPIILHEQSNVGKTIIEKFEHHSNNVGYAVVLLTPDDLGCSKNNKSDLQPRARQNVIFELGYFFAKLERKNVCALYKEGVEIPSDIYGVVYVPMDEGGSWKYQLAKELRQAALDVDLNKI